MNLDFSGPKLWIMRAGNRLISQIEQNDSGAIYMLSSIMTACALIETRETTVCFDEVVNKQTASPAKQFNAYTHRRKSSHWPWWVA
uniref:Transposase n=1 Tax=Heterorhabditis bacteriophora TaxID=37862 RepID=A0A1I7XJM0_HETBA